MQWTFIGFAVFSLLLALTACAWSLRTSRELAAHEVAMNVWRAKHEATSASLVQLAEVQDAIRRAEDLLQKVNRREIAASKRRQSDGTFSGGYADDDPPLSIKDRLRVRAGLRAGQVPKHQ